MNTARGAAFAVISGGEQRLVRLVATLFPQARVAWSVSDVGFDEGGAPVLRDWLQIVQHLGRVDGIIIGDSRVNDRRFELVRSLGLPAVLVGVPWDEDPIPHVENSLPGAGVDEAVDHLVELGHRRIAYIGGPNNRVQALHRRDTFLRKIEEAGLEPVAAISTRYSPNSAALHTDQLLELAAPPTAILYGSDPMALGGIRAAHRRGVSYPRSCPSSASMTCSSASGSLLRSPPFTAMCHNGAVLWPPCCFACWDKIWIHSTSVSRTS